jgi:hypothetical protein
MIPLNPPPFVRKRQPRLLPSKSAYKTSIEQNLFFKEPSIHAHSRNAPRQRFARLSQAMTLGAPTLEQFERLDLGGDTNDYQQREPMRRIPLDERRATKRWGSYKKCAVIILNNLKGNDVDEGTACKVNGSASP